MKKKSSVLLLLSFLAASSFALPVSAWLPIDSVTQAAISSGRIPGAVVCVVKDTSVVYLKAFGNRQVYPQVKPMTTSTIFDLASLSKPTGTAMAVMLLVQQGRLSLADHVVDYISGFNDTITIAHLLTHTSGLPAYINVSQLEKQYGSPAPDSLLMRITELSHGRKTGIFRYSCLNFVTLQHVVQNITGQTLADFYHEQIAVPLGMNSTTYCPPSEWMMRIAPTENIKVGRRQRRLLHGEVHDPIARVLNGGNSGNAGLFSTASDLAKLCVFLLNPETVRGPLTAQTVHLMTTIPEGFEDAGRTLGWDSQSDYNGCLGHFFSKTSYCHTGYTGTSIAIDPQRKVAVIVLTNRVHPKDKGSVAPLRREIADVVAQLYPQPDYPEVDTPPFNVYLEDLSPLIIRYQSTLKRKYHLRRNGKISRF